MGIEKEEKVKFVSGIRLARKDKIKNFDIAKEVISKAIGLLDNSNITGYIMACYLEMLRLYEIKSKALALDLLQPIYDEKIKDLDKIDVDKKTITLLDKVYEYDYELHNSTAQALRSARGFFLECVLESLFVKFSPDNYMAQVKVRDGAREKRIDFVVGLTSISQNIDNLLYVTVKKSLRERVAQVSDEKQFLGNVPLFFFYADDVKLSDGIMQGFYDDDIVMVAPEYNIAKHYAERKNVISYEKFFLEMLPAYLQEPKNFAITQFNLETAAHQQEKKKSFIIVKKEK